MEGRRGGARKRVSLRVGGEDAGRPLGDVLRDALRDLLGSEVPRSRVRAMIAGGAVLVDGAPVRAAARPLRAGQRIHALARLDALRPPVALTDRAFRLGAESILFRDRWIVAVAKPPGLPTHPTADPGRPSLVGEVEAFLAREGHAGRVAVHQRLDRDTSGVVVFGLDRAANEGLARAFAGHRALKTYLALTARPVPLPPRSFRIDAPLGAGGGAARPVRVGGPGAKPARTEARILETLPLALLVEARPRTGRRHQVRVHLAHAGLPVLGDPLYGDGCRAARTMLHASSLSLEHPVTGAPLVLDCALPEDFSLLLSRLRASRR